MKTFLFIDGTNLYAAQYELFGPPQYLHFPSFIKEIENKLKVKFDKIYFYASYSPQPNKPTKKEKLYLKNEALFYRSVKQAKNTVFFTGYRSKTSGKEKEVDVKLAVDIVDFAHRNKYQSIYFFSGDADFLQALFAIKSLNKKIFVICIENQILYRAPFFFHTYIFKTEKQIGINFKRFQKYSFISLRFTKLLKKI
jgi:uncharacterized LabA/DUF88 family protein